MKNKRFRELLEKFPDDYDVCLSKYFIYIYPEDKEPYYLVSDNSVVGILANDDSQEIRMMIESSSEEAVKTIEGETKLEYFSEEVIEAVDKLIDDDKDRQFRESLKILPGGKDGHNDSE